MRDCLYIQEPPQSIPCWYCGLPCEIFNEDLRRWPNSKFNDYTKWEYECTRHLPLQVIVSCVKHEVEAPNWFFNRIIVQYDKLRLYWNFYAGPWVHIEQYVRNKMGSSEWKFISIQDWPPKWETYPPEFLNQDPSRLLAFFKLYKVWS